MKTRLSGHVGNASHGLQRVLRVYFGDRLEKPNLSTVR